MKKIITIIIFMMILCTSTAYAQTLNLNITQVEYGEIRSYCENLYDSINVSKDPSCNGSIHWRITYYPEGTATDYYADNVTFPFNNTYEVVMVQYWGCDVNDKWFQIYPLTFENVPEPWTEDTKWLAQGENYTLYAYGENMNILWPDGSTGYEYTITGPENAGKVWVRMYNQCGSVSDTINVYYNSDISMATVDPQTDHIIVSWEVDPLLAQDLESLIIIRDGYEITTVPYIQGQYIDEAVSGSATSRTYRCKAIAKDGSVCNFNSDPKPSIHMVYTVGYFGTVEMQFNDVASNYEALYQYYISQWNDGDITHVDSIMPNKLRNGETLKTALGHATMRDGVINYSAPESYFSDGYLIVEADLNGSKNRDTDKFLSNRSENTVSVKTFETVKCSIFPNPARHQFTVSGIEMGTITLYNSLGQVILTQEIRNETIITVNGLTPGTYIARIVTTENKVHTQNVVVK